MWHQMLVNGFHRTKMDYCADKLLKYKRCYHYNMPNISGNCSHQKHDYAMCQKEDYYLRMREYERERRLQV